MQKITPQLMFEGHAEEAINFYLTLFKDSTIVEITRYGPGQAGPEGTVAHATFILAGQTFNCIDSSTKHDFTFTPSITLTVECTTPQETEFLFGRLSVGGKVFMPLDTYPFCEKLGWVADKYGVSWQLILKR